MSDLWRTCRGRGYIRPLRATVIRVAESQEQVATTRLVDTPEEQGQLENLLERTKPPSPPHPEHYHYLLWTPFRYPPLSHGSRFGRRAEHGLFYGSLSLDAALAECAYYRFVFLSGMTSPPPVDRLTTEHCSFKARIDAANGVALELEPFSRYSSAISDPSRYEASQALGTAMREDGVEAFTYVSARQPGGINAGAFSLPAIRSRRPEQMQHWLCTSTGDAVSFIRLHGRGDPPYTFRLAQFLVSDVLPAPAC